MATSEPLRSERILVFRVEASARGTSGNGLENLLAYLSESGPHASLSCLDGTSSAAAGTKPADMKGAYVFRAHSKNESMRLEEVLRSDPRVQRVYRPPAYRSRRIEQPAAAATTTPTADTPWNADIAAKIAAAASVKQWGFERCGFRDAKRDLDKGADLAPIVMIDNGSHLGHPQLGGVIRKYVGTSVPRRASIADHSGSVAAIMAAHRGSGHGDNAVAMDGCCSAGIEMFNTWTTHEGLDHDVLYNGLAYAIAHRRPVVNMSIWLHDDSVDEKVAELLDECERNNIVVVAAIGNAGTSPERFFPATHPTVVAVAGSDAGDQRSAISSVGDHAFIAAPGENIYTVVGDTDYDRMTGTSFAAPFVSAAAWLAKRQRPELTAVQVRWLLSRSVADPNAKRNPEMGFGRLDMRQLVKHLKDVPSSDTCARFLDASRSGGATKPAYASASA
jgi:subtilase family protein